MSCCFAISHLAEPEPEAKNLTVYTGNCYCFPEDVVELLKTVTGGLTKVGWMDKQVDLVSGITHTIPERIQMIAENVIAKDPDVAVFQELWGDKNKKRMQSAL